jgi:N-acetylmuramoyl-L-alanine amidase
MPPDPAPLSVDTPNVLELQFILVTVRTDFRFEKPDGRIVFHWSDREAIPDATVELIGLNSGVVHDTATTDRNGQAALETSQLPDGNYTVRITPKNSRNELAGPGIAETDPAPLPNRMYHPLDVTVKLSGGLVELATIDTDVKYAGLGNFIQPKWPPDTLPTDHLPIDLKPIWMRAPRAATARARGDDQIKMVVIHNTGADRVPEATIGPDINTFLSGGSEIHYLMDLNGHVIKFMKDHVIANHAGGKWKGLNSNAISIGIEIVHKEAGEHEYTRDQYLALPSFLERVQSAYGFDRTQLTGHSDVGTRIPVVAASEGKPVDLDLLDSHRDQDPGQIFQWEYLEQRGWGMIPGKLPLGDDAYGKLFAGAADFALQRGDKDATHRFGGKNLPGTPGTPIKELQQDLADIGYSLKAVNGHFNDYTELAVKAFQRHFFSGSRRRAADGRVDTETAQMIKNVRSGL